MKIMIAVITILIICAVLILLAYLEYRKTFYVRMADPTGFTEKYLKDHSEIRTAAFACPSSRGCAIRGIRFIPDRPPRALIVMTHGYNMSIENYLPLAKYFRKSGYMVLMFDGIGTGMSEGCGIYGLPQHTLDMKSVLDAVSADEELSDLPLLLFGHSWGGYAACTVNSLGAYPVRGILTCSAFRKSSSSMIPTIKRRYPGVASFLIACVEFLERRIFGPIASVTSSEGIKKTSCPVKMYHSRDDSVVSFEETFITMQRDLSGRENITFAEINGRNHNLYLKPENDRRQREINKLLRNSLPEQEADALKGELWSLMSETDEKLAIEFVKFFDDCIK